MMWKVGDVDQVVRIVAGAAIIGAGIVLHSWWGAVGGVPLLSGLFR